jgi:ABC-type nitrate/sulfonate/bicarbonate transport system substrate-binding protein
MVRRWKFRRSLIVTASVMLITLLGCKTFAQEKFKFPIGESSKTLSYGPLWVAAKMGFLEREGLDVPIITMRGSAPTIQALTADSIYVANATVDTLIKITAEQGILEEPLPQPAKYVDQSYLKTGVDGIG